MRRLKRERELAGAKQKLVTLEVDSEDADASGFEPIWLGERLVGFVTSGAYGHCVKKSLAMAYIAKELIAEGAAFNVHIVGQRRSCKIIARSPFDPSGARLRA
jgi:dimethylglycine dehydrogenase